MKSIEELQADVKKLYQELEERKKMEQTAAPQTVNFREISAKAQRYAIQGHPMAECDEHIQQMYLLVLLSVAALDDTAYMDSFCTIYRIAHGMHYAGDVQELFLSAQQMNFDKLDECTRLFLGNEKRLLLLLECMLVAGTFDAGRKQAMAYLAQLCVLMQMTKEEIVFLSNLARVVLTQDIQQYQCDIMNEYAVFDCYLEMLKDQIKIEFLTYKKDAVENQMFRSWGMKFINIDQKKRILNYQYNEHGFMGSSIKDVCLSYSENEILIQYVQNELGRFSFSSSYTINLAVTANTPLAYRWAVQEFDVSIDKYKNYKCVICGELLPQSYAICPRCGAMQ